MDRLGRKKILKKNGRQYTEIKMENAFKDVQWIVYYFGAKWCSDCVKFTPLLRDVYLHAKSTNEPLEVLYVSSDRSEEEMKEFAAESHPDWYLYYVCEDDDSTEDFANVWNFRDDLAIWGIPSIVVIKDDQIFCSTDGVSDVLSKGVEVVAQWKKKIINIAFQRSKQIQLARATEDAIIPNCCRITRFKPWIKTPPTDILKGMKLWRKTNKEFVEETADFMLKRVDIVGFYFSGHWSGQCHIFTPTLKACYDQLKKEKKSFEIIFVPVGETVEQWQKFMQDVHGDWLVTLSDETTGSFLDRKFHVEEVPTLRIVNKSGDLVSMEGQQDVQVNGAACYPRWLEGKPGATEEDVERFWDDQTKPVEQDNDDEENKED